MEKYKIKVNNEAESKEAQELFFELGYKWSGGQATYLPIGGFTFITAYPDAMRLAMGWGGDTEIELTLAELRELVAKSKSTEQGLISGADALRALADGEEVELQAVGDMNWYDSTQWTAGELLCFKGRLRIKPTNIKLELDIPAPFDPKAGDMVWCLTEFSQTGYEARTAYEPEDFFSNLGYWRTEEEIKQVVAALRGALKNG